jgi:hypothetical protein
MVAAKWRLTPLEGGDPAASHPFAASEVERQPEQDRVTVEAPNSDKAPNGEKGTAPFRLAPSTSPALITENERPCDPKPRYGTGSESFDRNGFGSAQIFC